MGNHSLLLLSEFSTILADSNRGRRDELFALLRMVHDGYASRDLGNVDEQLRWSGRATLLAACTNMIDTYAAHADALGPR